MKNSLMHCPTCGVKFDPRQLPTLPFCSERCRQIDLGRWLDEEYAIEVLPDPDGDVERDFDATDPADGGEGNGGAGRRGPGRDGAGQGGRDEPGNGW